MDPCQATQKTIIGKFPPRNPQQQQQQHQPRLRTRPKQSILEGKPLCNSTSGGDAGGGPITHQQNQSGTGQGNLFPVERRSVLPPYRPHDDQQRQPLFDFPPSTKGTSGVGIFGIGVGIFGSTPISETTPLSVRGLPGPRGKKY